MLQSIITQFLSGFSVVAILVIAALGLAIIFGVAGVINMAHGELIMVGAYTAAIVGKLGGNTFAAIPVAFVVVGLLGLVIERGIIQWIYDRPLETLLATWGVGIILQTLVKLIFGPELYYVGAPKILDGGFRLIGRLPFPWYRLFLIVMAILLLLLVFYVIFKSDFGLKVRAVRRNRAMSGCLGINTAQGRHDDLRLRLRARRHRRRGAGANQVGVHDHGFSLRGRRFHGARARRGREPVGRARRQRRDRRGGNRTVLHLQQRHRAPAWCSCSSSSSSASCRAAYLATTSDADGGRKLWQKCCS